MWSQSVGNHKTEDTPLQITCYLTHPYTVASNEGAAEGFCFVPIGTIAYIRQCNMSVFTSGMEGRHTEENDEHK